MREFMKSFNAKKIFDRRPRGAKLIGIAIVLAIVVAGTGIRLVNGHNLKVEKNEDLIPTVSVVRPAAAGTDNEIVLPGTIEAWAQAPVYARTNGYLKTWHVDIGAQVKAGELLAEIDAPDVSQQAAEAKANLLTATAQLKLADTTAQRWEKLYAQNAVSQQDMEDKRNELSVRRTMASAAEAEFNRLKTMQEFSRIVAPFDGTVTSRSTDVGSLIVAGNAATRPLFTVANLGRMRIYTNVPQNYMEAVTSGMKAHLVVPQKPDRIYPLELAHTAEAINRTSGTMLVQFTIDNKDRSLKAGSYAQIHILLPQEKTKLRIPASTLLFKPEGMLVMTIKDGDKVALKPVRITRDFGSEVEVDSGLTSNDLVIDSPPDALLDGDKVHILQAAQEQKN